MATIIKPPTPLPHTFGQQVVFLAGSIEMGAATHWQTEFEQAFQGTDVVLLNPRRDTWEASWPQQADYLPFREQVEWELAAQERADIIAMYFAPETKAPITLLELGLFARSQKLIVCCPEGYWRKGNVDVVCQRYGIPQVSRLSDLVLAVKHQLAQK
jgi:hypothetical protein